MNWIDYYTSYELSKKIKEIKGVSPEWHQYWNWSNNNTFIWLELDPPYFELIPLCDYHYAKKYGEEPPTPWSNP